jgi:SAM-dependent methyltransferase
MWDTALQKIDVKKYESHSHMIIRFLKKHNIKYQKDFFANLYMLHNKTKKKWSTGFETKLEYKFSENVLSKIPTGKHLVDFGCGDGRIMKLMSGRFKPTKQTCVDVSNHQLDKSSDFVLNEKRGDFDVNFSDNSIGILSAIQSIHHVSFLEDSSLSDVVNNMIDKIAFNGVLLIREHDVKQLDDLYPVILEHLLYDVMETDKKMSFDELKIWVKNYHVSHRAWYFSKQEIDSIISKRMSKTSYEDKKGKNGTFIYNALYVKNVDHPTPTLDSKVIGGAACLLVKNSMFCVIVGIILLLYLFWVFTVEYRQYYRRHCPDIWITNSCLKRA